MYSASQRKVGEYSDRMRLEVGTKFFSSYLESQCRLLKMGISGFFFEQGLTYNDYKPLLPVFIFFK